MLCQEQRITQKELAERIYISPQTISKIIGVKASLTEPTARAIIELFPSYSLEWLLGYSEYKTVNEQFDALLNNAREQHDKRITALIALASLRGYEITLYSSGLAIGPSGGYEDEYLVRQGKKQIVVFYSDAMEWIDDLADFAELKIRRKLKI